MLLFRCAALAAAALCWLCCLQSGEAAGEAAAESTGKRLSDADLTALITYLSGEYENKASQLCTAEVTAEWGYNVDLTNKAVQEEQAKASLAQAQFRLEQWNAKFKGLDLKQFTDPVVQRQVKKLQVVGTAALSSEKYQKLNTHLLNMQTAYSTAKICPYKNQKCDLAKEGLNLEPGIEAIISTSRDYDELLYAWKGWRDASGKLMRSDYEEYVTLQNEAAKLNNFADMGALWQDAYETDDFYNEMQKLWTDTRPLYDELHKYTRRRLHKLYGDKIGTNEKFIPAHILGNMWAQTWTNIYDLLIPYPDASSYDVSDALKKQGYTAVKMFEKADEFYKSLGLVSNEMCYGSKALIEKPTDGREVTCHASAWDFCDKTDFRIKMCTKVDQEDFTTIHHEMGHIQYYQQYKNQPYELREGANEGFHEAIGDTMSLSVDNPKHLTAIGLLTDYKDTEESSLNALMKMALDKVAFLPFGLLVDMWRWDVFSGKVGKDKWNAHWWELRESVQGITAPTSRSEVDFDPGAKYHVPADSKYISYFVSYILQFQLYRALCIEAGQYKPNDATSEPLHKCDFYKSTAAGTKFSAGLKLGASKHWSEVLQVMTGETKLSSDAILEYFKPLQEYLKKANSDPVTDAPTTAPPVTSPTLKPSPGSAASLAGGYLAALAASLQAVRALRS